MGGFTFEASAKNADAPNIEGGMYDALFLGIDTKTIKGGKFTKNKEDGDPKLEWAFALLDDEGNRLQDTDPETDEVRYRDGDPVEVEATGLTSTSMNTKSETQPRGVRYLKAISTPAEFAAFEAGEGIPGADLILRPCQVEVAINDRGYPNVVNVLPPRKRRATRARTTTEDEE
jgi:hypothetical protein